jgi:hypothetical protein
MAHSSSSLGSGGNLLPLTQYVVVVGTTNFS